ncbi:Maf family nucleotide pyrophosphatase [Persicobacter sp. CCB-QB2]|uniref:Maf family nucleotide pyrophosphatase n=1 Tax=Persicobacter sp. CCB-QB2 TaxID=1561025 RepID=UPI0006A9F671|nr:Maf family nucleotide pyrophosphatase [Persicobacter sp. CCB-QB2]
MIDQKKIILASQSPRRRELLAAMRFPFEAISLDVDESFPADMPAEEVAAYLAEKKAKAYTLKTDELVIASDTVVVVDGKVLGKPADADEAFQMLQSMSGKQHQVISGFCIRDEYQQVVGDETTEVFFRELEAEEINYYIEHYKPYDKAGAYGIQEWIGMIGISRIEGSYYNVMGLPVQQVYEELKNWSK